MERLPTILEVHLHGQDRSAEYPHGLSPSGVSVLFLGLPTGRRDSPLGRVNCPRRSALRPSHLPPLRKRGLSHPGGRAHIKDIWRMAKGDRDESGINKEECRSPLGQPFITALSRAINLGQSQSTQHTYPPAACGAHQPATVPGLPEERPGSGHRPGACGAALTPAALQSDPTRTSDGAVPSQVLSGYREVVGVPGGVLKACWQYVTRRFVRSFDV